MTSPADEPKPWSIHGERTVYDNKWVQLALVDVEPPGVERFEHHVVRLSRVAIAAVVDDDDRVLMLWRYRFVPQRFGWELPGGIVDDDEDPAVTAAREVEEETGWRPHELHRITSYQPMVGMVDSPHEIFVGRGATLVGDPHDAEEAGKSCAGFYWLIFRSCSARISYSVPGRSSRCCTSSRSAVTALDPLAELVDSATLAD